MDCHRLGHGRLSEHSYLDRRTRLGVDRQGIPGHPPVGRRWLVTTSGFDPSQDLLRNRGCSCEVVRNSPDSSVDLSCSDAGYDLDSGYFAADCFLDFGLSAVAYWLDDLSHNCCRCILEIACLIVYAFGFSLVCC